MTQLVAKKGNNSVRVFTTGTFSLTAESWVNSKKGKNKKAVQ